MPSMSPLIKKMRHHSCQSDHKSKVPDPVLGSDFQQALGEVCLALNTKIHACIDKMIKRGQRRTSEHRGHRH